MTRIEEIEKRLQGATKHAGLPWSIVDDWEGEDFEVGQELYPGCHRSVAARIPDRERADFIVNAPTDISYLLDLVYRMSSLLSSTADDEECKYDHGDFCQVHGRPHPCAHGEATELLRDLNL